MVTLRSSYILSMDQGIVLFLSGVGVLGNYFFTVGCGNKLVSSCKLLLHSGDFHLKIALINELELCNSVI